MSSFQSQSILPDAFYRMGELATTAERRPRTYTTKDGTTRTIKGRPEKKGLLPFGETTIYEKVRRGEFPSPTRLSQRVTVWRGSEIIEWLNSRQ